jgi:hypothetical protein
LPSTFIERLAENRTESKLNQPHIVYSAKNLFIDWIKDNPTKSLTNYILPTGTEALKTDGAKVGQ